MVYVRLNDGTVVRHAGNDYNAIGAQWDAFKRYGQATVLNLVVNDRGTKRQHPVSTAHIVALS